LQVRREEKHDKLLQYAERVWRLRDGNDDGRIDQAIELTRIFFESLNVKTRLSDYGIKKEAIPEMVAQLKRHGMVALGEHRDMDIDASRRVFESAA